MSTARLETFADGVFAIAATLLILNVDTEVSAGTHDLGAELARAWIGTFSSQPEVLAAGETYLRIVGPSYGFFGLGLALYFASQGAGRLLWPLAAGFARLLVAVGGGWLAVTWLGELPALFAAITLGFLVFGGAQAAAINATLRQATGAAELRLPVLCSHPRPRR